MRVAPCKNCEKSPCGIFHDKCEEYLKWKKEKAAANKIAFERERHKRRNWY